MTAKFKALPGGMHTAGLFSDMTLDGPEIGTLVVIVDRAKNLPNRKTIGKQDPYCAARLGKEAKKTNTDRRGGQTPRWDQELRFTVHDSADYYQLKVSVFNDDKKTELIGETWVNLHDVIVAGGGQNDIWHTLNFRGKYAGEIRIEITFYDSRPKAEKQPEKVARQVHGEEAKAGREGLSGPRQPKPIKRRPLPADPTASTLPSAAETPTPPRQPQSFIKNQSPLQSIEQNPYHTPSPLRVSQPRGPQPQPVPQSATRALPSGAAALPPKPVPENRHSVFESPEAFDRHFDQQHALSPQPVPSPYDYPVPDSHGRSMSPGGPPPPPPAHRSSHHHSPAALPAASAPPPVTSHDSYGFSAALPAPNTSPYDAPAESHRHSVPAYPGQQQYQAIQPYAPRQEQYELHMGSDPNLETALVQPYNDLHHANYAAMQPFVEDCPPSPSPMNPRRSSFVETPNDRFNDVPSPAPLNLNSRASVLSGNSSISSAPSYQTSGLGSVVSSTSATSYGESTPSYPTGSYKRSSRYAPSVVSAHSTELVVRRNSEEPPRDIADYGIVALPNSLVAGMDPEIAREISERIYQDRRGSFNGASQGTLRGRNPDPQQYSPVGRSQYEAPMSVFVPAAATPYDDRQSRIMTGTIANTVKARSVSPERRLIPRKSVSPAPTFTEERRLSGIPFGPDSYNALNPALESGAGGFAGVGHDPDEKIIMHDGTEVDPSDHLPRDSWAPEPEKKGPKYASQMPDQSPLRSRVPAPNPGPPATGRRQLRIAGRPHSMAGPPSSYVAPPMDPLTPPARNRLQKKSNRASTMSTPNGMQSSPLAPISPHDNSYGGFVPKPMARAHTTDFENYSPTANHYGSSPGYRNSIVGPPLPAKLPIASQPLSTAESWNLLEEMKNIDLGSGGSARSRRKRF